MNFQFAKRVTEYAGLRVELLGINDSFGAAPDNQRELQTESHYPGKIPLGCDNESFIILMRLECPHN